MASEESFAATPTILFSTGFEASEGYDSSLDLEDQQGWTGTGTGIAGDNGLIPGWFPGFGQQAYIGYSLDATDADFINVWKPINLAPVPTNYGLIKFSVLMSIVDSGNGIYDCFRWSVYNTNGNRLFTLDFDNSDLSINYLLQNQADFVFTGVTFLNGSRYQLQILMDFARNQWRATLGNVVLVTGQPITTANSPLNLGDIDAVWFIRNFGFPGDNFMVFDNYEVIADPAVSTRPPTLTILGRSKAGEFAWWLTGEPTRKYAVETSTNLTGWTAIVTNTAATNGTFDFSDATSPALSRRYYRARLVP